MNKEQITVETMIKAEPQKIWRLWTQPTHITKWNFANDQWHCPTAENDLRVGGRFSYRMEAKNGDLGFDFEGVYDEVIDHQKIVYTLSDGRESTTTFENLGDHTKLTTTFDTEPANPTDIQKEGWQAILDNFKNYVEEN